MQKALFEMNVQLSNVISDVSGESGLHILEAIIAGERDPEQLAALFCKLVEEFCSRIRELRSAALSMKVPPSTFLFCRRHRRPLRE